MKKIKLCAIAWKNHLSLLLRAARQCDWLDLAVYSSEQLQDRPDKLEEALQTMLAADGVYCYRSTEGFWAQVEEWLAALPKQPPTVCIGHDPATWAMSNVGLQTVSRCHDYFVYGGEDNYVNMLRYIAATALGQEVAFEEPKVLPWEGFYHPGAPRRHYEQIGDYLAWYEGQYLQPQQLAQPVVGVLIGRGYWASENLEVEDAVIAALEAEGLRVLPIFAYSMKDDALGARGSAAAVRDAFLAADGSARIQALVKLQGFFMGTQKGDRRGDSKNARGSVSLLQQLDVPVFGPIVTQKKTLAEWEADNQGIGSGIAWSVSMPEFEGVIEPMVIAAARSLDSIDPDQNFSHRQAIPERCQRLAQRVRQWIRLRQTPVAERKVAFILHNNPCASLEATIGGGAHLDTLQSLANVMHRMQAAGYRVTPPSDGKELIDTIMSRKAIAEFRWTTVDEIVSKGGVLGRVSVADYEQWWQHFPDTAKKRMVEAWGKPPGEFTNNIPPAMVHEGAILVTGVEYGNAVVCVQPKRGCAGPRCDGQVCKILHDPDVPPPHQYMATYRYLENIFNANMVVHVGTHGNIEFLPGKGVGLGQGCMPDLAINTLPHLYIYNSDNPPEGAIAKRRSLAVLVDHMQTVMQQSGLYEELEEIDRLLGEHEQAQVSDKGRAHTLEHLIIEAIEKSSFKNDMKYSPSDPIEETLRKAHEGLSRVRNSQIQDGMHVFGSLPQDERRVAFLNAVLRYDAGQPISIRKMFCQAMGLQLSDLLAGQGQIFKPFGLSGGQLLERISECGRALIQAVLYEPDRDLAMTVKDLLGQKLQDVSALEQLPVLQERILELAGRLEQSKEIEALLHAFDGGHVLAGPSGLIMRGRDDVLPTGRNFYSLDPSIVPTRAAAIVGERLAKALLEKHMVDEDRLPENVAIYWQANDIMWSDGEGMGQIMALLGVRPKWLGNGKVNGFEIIPLQELGRPRIDVTIRMSGILRDNFPNCMELVDEAIVAVASLDEPVEMNYVRKHALENLAREQAEGGGSEAELWRRATFRIFSAKPGTYAAGVNLAVYASAWKNEADLADIFVYWNGYAYGKDAFGPQSQSQLINNLRTVDVTFNKAVSDEYDLFGCCGYFGNHGGMTAAARNVSGRKVKGYYGDTREPESVAVNDLADEIRRVVRTKLLNPKWIEGMKRHGYKGAGDISKRVGRVYGWEATTQEVDDWVFDDISKTFVLDAENRQFFKENNPWALEEIGRRLLEAQSRGLWQADPEVLEQLKDRYLEVEGWIEESMGDVQGDFQGGAIDVMAAEDVGNWREMMQGVKQKMAAARQPAVG
ncbi:MAG: cobaltochelatase subunit CobN [Brachymonas sp.]|nr:cobaltochelatase subunit CobN [Brachymonas sp.]